MPLYRSQSINLYCKSIDWFLFQNWLQLLLLNFKCKFRFWNCVNLKYLLLWRKCLFGLSLRLIQKCDLLGKFSFFCPFVDISSLSLTCGKQINLKSILFCQVYMKDEEMKCMCLCSQKWQLIDALENVSSEKFWKISWKVSVETSFFGKISKTVWMQL